MPHLAEVSCYLLTASGDTTLARVSHLQGMYERLSIGSFEIIHENLHIQQAPRKASGIAHDGERSFELIVHAEANFPVGNGHVGKLGRKLVSSEPRKRGGEEGVGGKGQRLNSNHRTRSSATVNWRYGFR